MKWLKSLRMARAVWLALVPLTIVVLALTALRVADAVAEIRRVERLSQGLPATVAMGGLIGALQKERGMSAGFTAGGGAQFGDKLAAQRRDTDAALDAFEAKLAELGDGALSPAQAGRVETALAQLAQVASRRDAVDALSMQPGDVVGYYTSIIRPLIDAVGAPIGANADVDVARGLAAAQGAVEAMERTGVMRAIGSAGFGRGAFSSGEIMRLERLAGERDAFLGVVRQLGGAGQVAALDGHAASEAVRRSEAMLALARGQGLDGDLSSLSGAEFFDAMTARLQGQGAIERALLDGVRARLDAMAEAARTALAVAVAGSVLGLAISLALAMVVAHAIRSALDALTSSALSLAYGDLDAPLPDATPNEIGEMGAALGVLRDNVLEAAAAKLAHDGEAAAREAKDAETAREREAMLLTIQNGVASTRDALDALARGDLDARIEGHHDGAFADLRQSLAATVAMLGGAISEIGDTSAAIVRSVRDIESGSSNLSQRASGQAASLEQIAATMEEMAATVKTNADRAAAAAGQSVEAKAAADRGGEALTDAGAAMERIQRETARIAEMVDVIEGFSFQTNLLALNASVEAARAGEAGRGFAVVAAEVRSLAERSATTAREVREIVNAAGEQVEEGSRLMSSASKALGAIVASIASVADNVGDISGASREQSTGVQEIATSLAQLDATTQENASVADASAASARGLAEQAAKLDALMSGFKRARTARRAA
ncbi:methyl-accepting chemotaxis protein [Rubrimonas cliftonensis]|uniref:Methyl-accepting chemotaxis protein n=1 Tax=Rubrimonas cliftonensis TaxID=89524 RepID=A0A1H4BW28_9RHOB|nr:nitrate- and nitrite sensing domain-containing protein [Rubrimonas cliftonensis]SEA52300.1 Methyl-accepting chemotaxis protein [Rubrimonas cliftonensis]